MNEKLLGVQVIVLYFYIIYQFINDNQILLWIIHFCLFSAEMESHQKTLLYLVALLVGEFLFFVLKAPQIYDNIKPSTPLRNTDDDLDDFHKRNMKSRFISRSSLSFCKNTSNDKLKGNKSPRIPRSCFIK